MKHYKNKPLKYRKILARDLRKNVQKKREIKKSLYGKIKSVKKSKNL